MTNKKYKIISAIVIIITIIGYEGCTLRKKVMYKISTHLPEHNLNAAQIAEDLDYLVSMNEKINPYPYLFCNKQEIDSTVKVIKKINSLPPIEFYKKIRLLTSLYNVPHFEAEFPEDTYDAYKENKGKLFSHKIMLKNNIPEIVSLSTCEKNKEIEKGDQIVSINGISSQDLITKFRTYYAGLTAWKNSCIEAKFTKLLWLEGIHSPFALQIVNSKKETKTIIDEGCNGSTINTTAESTGISEMIAYEQINDSVSYINFKSMAPVVTAEKFKEELDKLFQQIKMKNSKLLFIDISENSGGSERYGNIMIKYFNDKKMVDHTSTQWWVSQEAKDSYRNMIPWYARWVVFKFFLPIEDYLKSTNNTFMKYSDSCTNDTIYPGINENRYMGKTYLITGGHTFSAAMLLADKVRFNNLAIVLGNNTGENTNDLSEMVWIRLPNSGIVCSMPTALFIGCNGNKDQISPVIPHIKIDLDNMYFSNKREKINFLLTQIK
jgi:C-terminal processing protease CtpA/Prc